MVISWGSRLVFQYCPTFGLYVGCIRVAWKTHGHPWHEPARLQQFLTAIAQFSSIGAVTETRWHSDHLSMNLTLPHHNTDIHEKKLRSGGETLYVVSNTGALCSDAPHSAAGSNATGGLLASCPLLLCALPTFGSTSHSTSLLLHHLCLTNRINPAGSQCSLSYCNTSSDFHLPHFIIYIINNHDPK